MAACQEFIPRTQTKPPGPPLSPDEALRKMVVPDGFHVELVASEPDLLNPVAMAFDDSGRIYVTESFEYPRHEPGPGRDRIKILDDTDGDGRVDKVTIFAEGLNIPSGIAVGHGGVWVANAPDILFLEDTNGDDVADKSTVIATGFGRDDTHELPNALTWGPDGYLYGLNGVFNRSVVTQGDQTFDFTCAMFRIHPRTRKFELFCEGTSNPWGIAFDAEGSAFVSACVIDHLWHLTESGYYLRQGGPYPPHTWWGDSIVKHKHQMAAYCGIEYFDSAAYPDAYREKLYMGNIHGGCINVDRITRSGATYEGFGEPDFLTANDVWFMPVAQKVGPDGCLYVLDWYDRYHCYQDASADPKGVDRGHGRLYRVVYGERPKKTIADIHALSNNALVQALGNENIFVRQRAQLELAERLIAKEPQTNKQLEELSLAPETPRKHRMHAMWALASSGTLSPSYLQKLMQHEDPELRAWGVRLAGDHQPTHGEIANRVLERAADPDPRVRIQVAIATPKFHDVSESNGTIDGATVVKTELNVLRNSVDDPILPRVVWRNLLTHIVDNRRGIIDELRSPTDSPNPLLQAMLPRLADKWVSSIAAKLDTPDSQQLLQDLFDLTEKLSSSRPNDAAQILRSISVRVRNGEFSPETIRPFYQAFLKNIPSSSDSDATIDASWQKERLIANIIAGDSKALEQVEAMVAARKTEPKTLRDLLLFAAQHRRRIVAMAEKQLLEELANSKDVDPALRDTILDLSIATNNSDDLQNLIRMLPKLKPVLQASIAEKMCQREPAASTLLGVVADGSIRKELIGPNRVRLLASNGSETAKQYVAKIWGTVNTESNQEREAIVKNLLNQMRKGAHGDPQRGWVVYDRICGQCHVMHGRGAEVGPNITANGRGSYEQLMVSVFNPSLVIGDAYKGVTIRTEDGTVVTGLLVSRDKEKTVLKVQGGKEQTILEKEIETFLQDKKSLMPEGIENQLSPQELFDLFALLTLEKPPESKENTILSGTPEDLHRSK